MREQKQPRRQPVTLSGLVGGRGVREMAIKKSAQLSMNKVVGPA